ncbi:MAG: hypothetical protein AB1461_11855 [Thermodesulfobacteriota bacterium]
MIRIKVSDSPAESDMTTGNRQSVDQEVKRYLETGEHEQNYSAWSSHDIIECAREMNRILVDALVAEVLRRESEARRHQFPEGFSPITFARRKFRQVWITARRKEWKGAEEAIGSEKSSEKVRR